MRKQKSQVNSSRKFTHMYHTKGITKTYQRHTKASLILFPQLQFYSSENLFSTAFSLQNFNPIFSKLSLRPHSTLSLRSFDVPSTFIGQGKFKLLNTIFPEPSNTNPGKNNFSFPINNLHGYWCLIFSCLSVIVHVIKITVKYLVNFFNTSVK
jgi:hypothetical protein